jgi:hypothetical protein
VDDNPSLVNLNAEAERLRRIIQDAQKSLSEITSMIPFVEKYGPILSGPKPVGNSVDIVSARLRGELKVSKKDRILRASEHILADGKRRISRQLLSDLMLSGVEVGGSDPVLNLSSYLSREKDRFTSNLKAGGWTLVRLVQQARPVDVDASTGFSVRHSA